jgi:hypothetical protein
MNFEVRNDSRSFWEAAEVKTSSGRIYKVVLLKVLDFGLTTSGLTLSTRPENSRGETR